MSDDIARQLATVVDTKFVFGHDSDGRIKQAVDSVEQDGAMYLLRAEHNGSENAHATNSERT